MRSSRGQTSQVIYVIKYNILKFIKMLIQDIRANIPVNRAVSIKSNLPITQIGTKRCTGS